MNYYAKYIKYKDKYCKLKYQLGGTITDSYIQTIELGDLHTIINKSMQDLLHIIPPDKFINQEEITRLIEEIGLDEIIDKLVINYIYKKDDTNVLNTYTNPDGFFTKLLQVISATHNLWIHLNKYIEANAHTVLLIPGDSPTYFLFVLKLLHPEITTNPKVTIVEFPISKLGSGNDVIEFKYNSDGVLSNYKINSDGKPYIDFIIKNNIPQSIRELPHQFVIIDYLEAGKSAVFIEHTIKELYDTQPFRLDKNFIKVINLAYYFTPTCEIQAYLSEYPGLVKIYNKKIKSNPSIFAGLEGAKRYEKFLLANWYLYLEPDFLVGLDNFATSNSINVLKYLVDESDRRCQYKLSLNQANELASESSSMTDFISKIPKPDLIHSNCNLFNILLYLICTQYEKLNTKCGELIRKLSEKIISLIPINTPIKLIINGSEIPGQIVGYDKLKAQFSTVDGKNKLIGLFDIKSIAII